ncbi:hypothetical protein D3C81_860490 [compost metagenome]
MVLPYACLNSGLFGSSPVARASSARRAAKRWFHIEVYTAWLSRKIFWPSGPTDFHSLWRSSSAASRSLSVKLCSA